MWESFPERLKDEPQALKDAGIPIGFFTNIQFGRIIILWDGRIWENKVENSRSEDLIPVFLYESDRAKPTITKCSAKKAFQSGYLYG